jgi:hypothetical protein
MVDAKQQVTQGFYPGSGRGGRTSSRGVLAALYCSAPGVPVVGLLQARQERKRGFQVPGGVAEDIVGELESKCVAQHVSRCVVSLSPPRLGGSSPFYRSRGRRITCTPCYLATWISTTCYAVEWAAIRVILAAIWSSCPDLYPNSGGSRVGEQWMTVKSSDRLEGGADAGLYEVQEQAERRSFPTRFTGLESLLQGLACACTRGYGGHAVTAAEMAVHRPSAST